MTTETDRQADEVLVALLRHLKARDYRFVTPTPATHARVVSRPGKQVARDLRDVLGWSLPFVPGTIDRDVESLLRQARALAPDGDRMRATVRVSSLDDLLFAHSAYPTDEADAVFFGPDSYRFAVRIAAELAAHPVTPGAHVVDIGTGSGVGGIVVAARSPGCRVTLTDINPRALRFAAVNARAAGVEVATLLSPSLDPLVQPIDLAIANPPYLMDAGARTYRDGGNLFGGQLPLDMARMAAERLAPGGRVLLYTGAAVVDGEAPLAAALAALAVEQGVQLTVRELDPDVFGEELDNGAYARVERIAVIAATLQRA